MFVLFCSKSFIKSNENKQTWIHARCGESKLPIHDNCLPKYGKTFKIIELKECNNLGQLMSTTFASSLIREILSILTFGNSLFWGNNCKVLFWLVVNCYHVHHALMMQKLGWHVFCSKACDIVSSDGPCLSSILILS